MGLFKTATMSRVIFIVPTNVPISLTSSQHQSEIHQDQQFISEIFMEDYKHTGTASYQFLLHYVVPVDTRLPLSPAQLVDMAKILSQLHHSVTQLLHAEYTQEN